MSQQIPPALEARPVAGRVLVVEPTPLLAGRLTQLAESQGYTVHAAGGADEALALMERTGAFECVFVAGSADPAFGPELLGEVGRGWPGTARVLVVGSAEPAATEAAHRALRDGRIFRVLRTDCEPDELSAAFASALGHAEAQRRDRELTEELAFARDALADLLGALDLRLHREVDNLRGVQELAQRLVAASSLDDVAQSTAEAVSAALDGRAVRIEVVTYWGTVAAEAGAGPRSEGALDRVTDEGCDGPQLFLENAAGLTPRDRRVLGSLLSSSILAAKSQKRRIERDEAQHAIVFALARLAERRDNETGQHLCRVSEYSRVIAEGLRADGIYGEQLTDRYIGDVVRSAPLHDIGKVGIPDHILLKPGKLTPDEWEVMRRHSAIGGDTIQAVIDSTSRPGFLAVARDIARHHHEKWDGSGYPDGLAGEAIPLCARIVALADVYDALTTQRPYKEPWSDERAVELIRRERGRHFDPHVVDAFLARADERRATRLAHPDEIEPCDDVFAA